MTLASHVIRSVTTADHHYDYLRTIGRNAFLGSHGNGGKQTVYVVETDRGAPAGVCRCTTPTRAR